MTQYAIKSPFEKTDKIKNLEEEVKNLKKIVKELTTESKFLRQNYHCNNINRKYC